MLLEPTVTLRDGGSIIRGIGDQSRPHCCPWQGGRGESTALTTDGHRLCVGVNSHRRHGGITCHMLPAPWSLSSWHPMCPGPAGSRACGVDTARTGRRTGGSTRACLPCQGLPVRSVGLSGANLPVRVGGCGPGAWRGTDLHPGGCGWLTPHNWSGAAAPSWGSGRGGGALHWSACGQGPATRKACDRVHTGW